MLSRLKVTKYHIANIVNNNIAVTKDTGKAIIATTVVNNSRKQKNK